MRIWIGGGISHGKSTLAKRISQELDFPHLDLDSIVFTDNCGGRRPEQETVIELDNFIRRNESWIIEGPQKREWCESGLKKADIILLLRISRWLALYRFFKRQFWLFLRFNHQRGRWITKIKWILFYERDDFPRYMNLIKKYEKFYLLIENNNDLEQAMFFLKGKSIKTQENWEIHARQKLHILQNCEKGDT